MSFPGVRPGNPEKEVFIMYKIKETSPDFRVVDGPYAGRLYASGQLYEDIPPQEAHRFDQVPDAAEQPVKTSRKTNKESTIAAEAETQVISGEVRE